MSNIENSSFRSNDIFEWKNIDIEIKNLNKNYDTEKIKLISDTCGRMEHGILAIMGSGGSGKTTLLRTLAGHIPENCSTTGQVLFNGKETKHGRLDEKYFIRRTK